MVHAIQMLKCENGHSNFSISFDSNHCGCHHNGDPCLIISCRDCFKEEMEIGRTWNKDIKIPMGNHTMEELREFSNVRNLKEEGKK